MSGRTGSGATTGGSHRADLDERLAAVVSALSTDAPLEPHHHDHALSGTWAEFRDCHLRPDLVLIYQKADPGILRLVRLGSHAEWGL